MKKLLYYSQTTLHPQLYRDSVKLAILGLLPDVAMPVDRSGIISCPVPVKYDPIPIIPERLHYLPLDDVFYYSAREIYNKGKPINLLWSGGIDSTAALVALIKHKNISDPPLTVVFNEYSVEEYPELAQYIRKNLNYFYCNDFLDYRLARYWNPEYFLSSGDCGDQLLGSRRSLGLQISFDSPWQCILDNHIDLFSNYNNLPPAILESYSLDAVKAIFLDCIQEIVDSCPIPLISAFDFFWYLNFRFKYHHVRWKILTYIDGTAFRPDMVTNYNPFYNNEVFQLWSLLNHPAAKHTGTVESYKHAFRTYAVNFTKDSWYLQKRKESSMPRVLGAPKISVITRMYENGHTECFKPI
jgi:hypothetical protein